MLTATMLKAAGVQHQTFVRDLGRKMRCRECDERGNVDVSVRWADQ
jgi:hypothetical protein